ncbi:MAG: gluconate 2-dehydrogenase subunit 3 family protein [Deltaproteobacteria bacterium]|nr:gluconate 2-dehydrogenase subunit 3 family protein [Deltaproteobacteria bacterium]
MGRLGLDRREFLERVAVLVGAVLVPLPLGCRSGCSRTPAPAAAKTFDPREWAVVEAACSRIIPTDDLPGAREANVVGFIDGQLADPNFAVFKREFEAGVSALELVAAAKFGSRFMEIRPEQQDEVLAALQDGEGSTNAFSAAHFFQVVFTLTIEGLLSDPVHGGNKDEAGWKVIGFVPEAPHPTRQG